MQRSNDITKMKYPTTPDGRYFVVRGQLWRSSNPALASDDHERFFHELMQARRDIRTARRNDDYAAEAEARLWVDAAKRSLGERDPVWWTDGAPDLNRHRVDSTCYADWYATIGVDDT